VVVSRWPSLQIKVTTVVEPLRDAARDLAVEALPGEARPYVRSMSSRWLRRLSKIASFSVAFDLRMYTWPLAECWATTVLNPTPLIPGWALTHSEGR
jgi:hypothetical protein